MRCRSAHHLLPLLGLAIHLLASTPAPALDWHYEYAGGVRNTGILDDPLHGRILLGTVEGFHYLDLPSGAWTSRDWGGWIGRQVRALAWHQTIDQRILTGRENAFFKGYIELSDDLGATERIVYSSAAGSVSGLANDPRDPARFYACTWSDVIAGEIVRSLDGGEHWQLLSGTVHHSMYAIDVDGEGTVYVGGTSRVTRSRDGGATWQPAWNGLPPGQSVHCVAADPDQPGRLTAGNDAGLFVTQNGGDQWDQVVATGCRSADWCEALATIPGGESYGFVAAVTSGGQVLLSRDWGATWEDETGNLPAAASDVTFSTFGGTLEAFVATRDRGVFRALVLDPASVAQRATTRASLRLSCAAPFPRGGRLNFATRSAGPVRLEICDAGGRLIAVPLDGWLDAGPQVARWSANGLPSGVYFGRVRAAEGAAHTRVMLLD